MDIIRISPTLSTTIVVLASLWIVGAEPASSPCPQTCSLPDCQCASKKIPGGLPRDQVPQMVTITFDGAIREKDYDMIYSKILRGRSNPNGCNVSATFFASHANTDYSLAAELANNGYFELAVHSVTDRTPMTFWSEDRNNTEELTCEILDMRDILSRWAHVPKSNVVGYRSPFLTSSENQLKILHENDFLYDSTMVTNGMYWPFTLDYKSPICSSPAVCPEESLPGLWVVPIINKLQNSGTSCNLIDSCTDMLKSTKEQWMNFFVDNFERHYNNNKAPFGLYATSSWFLSDKSTQRLQAFMDFLDYLGSLEDVYIVTMSELIAWTRNPTPLDQLSTFDPWQCPDLLPTTCTHTEPNICRYRVDGQEFIIRLCKDDICPEEYPNIKNPQGVNSTLSSTSVTLTSEIISTSITSTSHISSTIVMSGSEINPSSSTMITSVTASTTSVIAQTSSVTAPSSSETTKTTMVTAPTSSVTAPTTSVTAPTTSLTASIISVMAETTSATPPTTSVTAPATKVTTPSTSVTAPTTPLTAETTSVTAPTTSVTTPTTSFTAPTSSLTAPTTSVTTPTTSVTAQTTSFTAPTSSLTAPTTLVTAPTSSVTAPTTSLTSSITSVMAQTTSVTAPTTSVTALTTSVTAPTTSFTAPTSSVIAPTTSVTTPTTSVTAQTTSVTAQTTSVTTPTTSITAPTSSLTAPITSVTTPTTSVTAQTTSVTTPTTSVTDPTTSVTAPASSVTAPASSVTAPTTSVTAPTTLVTAQTTTVTAPTTSLTVPTTSVTAETTSVTDTSMSTTTPTITSATPTTVTSADPQSTSTSVPRTEVSRQQTRSVAPGVVAGVTIVGVMAIAVAVTGVVILVYIKRKQMHSRAPTSVSPELGLSLVNPGADST